MYINIKELKKTNTYFSFPSSTEESLYKNVWSPATFPTAGSKQWILVSRQALSLSLPAGGGHCRVFTWAGDRRSVA